MSRAMQDASDSFVIASFGRCGFWNASFLNPPAWRIRYRAGSRNQSVADARLRAWSGSRMFWI